MRRTHWLLSLALLALGGTARAEQGSYSLIPLSTLGGTASLGSDINGQGKAVGHSLNSVAIWRGYTFVDGDMGDLGTLGGSFSIASQINIHGHMVGAANITGDTETHAVVWTEFGPVDLGTISGYKSAQGLGINKHGAVVGEANLRPLGGFALPNSQAFYVDGGGMIALPTLDGRFSRATDINDRGTAVGNAEVAGTDDVHAVVWSRSKTGQWNIADLGTLAGYSRSGANAINNKGVIVGWSFNSTLTASSAFVYNGSMVALPSLGGARSAAAGVNKHGVIVGWSELPLGIRHAAMWVGGAIIDINTLVAPGSGWVLNNAAAISDRGDIIGSGTDPLGRTRAFILKWHPGHSGDNDD